MTAIEVDSWYVLPNDRLVRVAEVDETKGQVLVESQSGAVDDWPLNVATMRWRQVPSDGFRVRLALDRASIESLASRDPVGIVALILADKGGAAETSEITRDVQRLLGEDAVAAWWKRTQRRAAKDDRIDDSEALQKRYRLVPEGGRKLGRHRARVSDDVIGEYRQLDADVLRKARHTAKSKVPPSVDEQLSLMAEAEYASDASIDPTQRFLAGEIAVHLGRWTLGELGERLGDAANSVDLTRVPDHDSRNRALELARARTPGPISTDPGAVPGTFASGMAVGGQWKRGLLDGADDDARLALVVAGIAWAAPGSSQRTKWVTEDYQRYATRVEELTLDARSLLRPESEPAVDAHLRHLLQTLEAAATTQEGGTYHDRCSGLIAVSFWTIGGRAISTASHVLTTSPPKSNASWTVLLEEAPSEARPRLKAALEAAYRAGGDIVAAMADYSRMEHTALVPWILEIARADLRATGALRYLLDALARASSDAGSAADGVTLAGTIWPDNRTVERYLDQMALAAHASALEGVEPEGGPVLLRGRAWQRLVAEVHAVVDSSREEAERARAERDELQSKVEEQTKLLEGRREALQEAKSSRTMQSNIDNRRVGINVIKPIARALDDSYESSSLAGLQDQLEVAMARLRVAHIAEPGDVVAFDPDRHEWVGDGYPSEEVRVLTPGFVVAGEDEDELVLSIARVGPTEPR